MSCAKHNEAEPAESMAEVKNGRGVVLGYQCRNCSKLLLTVCEVCQEHRWTKTFAEHLRIRHSMSQADYFEYRVARANGPNPCRDE